ncbi:hypothetical protein C4578_00560 [Candidatus Microgenomates bacterium]|jgi:YYY domain-containing protein|nr:MAG: hypothetical protein C4578_00560 [Candidatus Microgenomates bacterium]
MLSDFGNILWWWFFIFIIGLGFLPTAMVIFGRFFDKGYLFAKVIGILFSSYLVWLLASLKLLPFFRESVFLVLVFGLALNLLLFVKNKEKFKLDRSFLIILSGEEFLFLGALVAWGLVRGFQPDIQGLEKFMDFGFVNSALRSKFMPPPDIWFAGKSINYYYFGHFIAAFLTKLSGLDSAITYNLMIATLFSFTFSLAFSITGNLFYLLTKEKSLRFSFGKSYLLVFAGLASSVLVSLGANLHPAFYNVKMSLLKIPYCDGASFYWYPNATRYIGYCPDVEDKTIHEFPSYSFVVSDLHGHVSDLPFVFLFIALLLNLFLSLKENNRNRFLPFLFSPLLSIMYMTNQWDFPIYLLALGLTLLAGYSYHHKLREAFFKTALTCFLVIVAVIPLILPFQLGFESIAKGVALVNSRSRFYQLLILWGAPWALGVLFISYLFGKEIVSLVKRVFRKVPKTLNFNLKTLPAADSFALILFAVATFLIIIPEIIYLKDIYIASYHRANTMFKLTYQSFVMFSLLSGYIMFRVASQIKRVLVRKTVSFLFFLIFSSLAVYPLYSIKGYYGDLKKENYKGLYGLNFLKREYPGDYEAINWLNKNIKGQPVVLEAVGDSYTDYNRVSMATGLPTVQGWLVHEWLWRGSFDEPGKRSGEVKTIYESSNINQVKELLKKYEVKYVFISKLEKQKYPQLNEAKFEKIGKKVFKSGEASVYELF